MRSTLFALVVLLVGIAFVGSKGPGIGQSSTPNLPGKTHSLQRQTGVRPTVNSWQFPLYFISNKGQVRQKVRFYARAFGYTLWLTPDGLVFDSIKGIKSGRKERQPSDKNFCKKELNLKSKRDVSRLVFLGANKNLKILPIENTGQRVNYFIGNDRSKWHTNVPTFSAVLYKNIYKNIDLKIYGIEKQIEYDWIVRPGGDPKDIRFEYQNVKNVDIDKEGNLVVETGFGRLKHKKPFSYQISSDTGRGDQRKGTEVSNEIKAKFKKLDQKTFAFDVAEYDRTKTLVIDPLVMVYSTYLGGSVFDYSHGIAVDNNGYAYITGYTGSSNFPTLNQYQSDQPVNDVFVTKIDTTQSGAASLVYSTYLGGSSGDVGMDIAVDNNGIAYITGYTSSTDFPTLNQYQSDPGDSLDDVFVTKIDTTQSGAASLLYSTYLGGNHHELSHGIAVDDSGCAYVTGDTNSTNFPTLNQLQTNQPDWDAFVSKVDTTRSGAASLVYSTYLGGNSFDIGYGIAADNSGNVYVTGDTSSTNFPSLNQYQSDQPASDVFLSRIDTTRSGAASLVYSTYLGGSSYDTGRDIAIDNSGIAYITGYTGSNDYPTLNQYQTYQGLSDSFISRIDTTRAGAACLLYSTYLGGNDSEYGYAIAADNNGGVVVSGYSDSNDFPTLNQYQGDQGGRDVYVSKIDTTLSGAASLIYSTYLGGSIDDYGQGIAMDSNGDVYVTGHTNSTDFPTLNQYQGNQVNTDAYVTRFSFNLDLEVQKIVDNGSPFVGDTVTFTVTVTNYGPLDASGLTISDMPPPGLTLISTTPSSGTYTSGNGAWDIGPLANGGIETLQLQAIVNRGGIITNTAFISSVIEEDGTPGNNSDNAVITTQHRVTASVSGGHGSVSPRNRIVGYGSNTSVSIIPDTGYQIASITDNGTSQPITNPYIIRRVTGNHTVVVTFEPITYTINALITGSHGSVSPASQNVSHGNNASITITPDNGYVIASITDNGVLQAITNPYLIHNIITDHTVMITFKPGIVLALTAVRKTDYAWIIRRDFGELQLSVSGHSSPVFNFKIFRSVDGGPLGMIKEIMGSELSSGNYSYLDTFLDKDKTYMYMFKAYDESGNMLGESNPVQI